MVTSTAAEADTEGLMADSLLLVNQEDFLSSPELCMLRLTTVHSIDAITSPTIFWSVNMQQ